MPYSHTEQIVRVCPPFRWAPLAWLTTSPWAPPAAAEELRASLFNRMMSLFTSAMLIFGVALAIAIRHPDAWFIGWAVLDAAFTVARLAAASLILHHRARHTHEAAPDNLVRSIYIGAGVLWCAALGCGVALCLASGDTAISTFGCLVATGTMGAQCGRVPGAPRLVVAQLILICLPLGCGFYASADPFLRWAIIALPVYVLALISINRQLHRDYVELVVSRYESRLMALRCPLTGLANRRAFDRALAAALAGPPGPARNVVVLSLDLDGFKAVNDAFGHLAGDLLLQQVAERLLQHVPSGGLTARLGGDEFAVLVRGAASAGAEQLACTLLAALREPFAVAGKSAEVGASVGLARATGATLPDALLGQADQALYAAKRGGKNRFCWHGDVAPAEEAPRLLRPLRA